EAPNELLAVHRGGLLPGRWGVTLEDWDSHPLRRELGVATGPAAVELAFWQGIDFRIGRGSVLWEHGYERGGAVDGGGGGGAGGGGAAALTAAFELTRGDWRSRFDSVVVYQSGWRLGGKGASGRGVGGRIEEHGLHVWFGAYDNAFALMRDCYAELDAPAESL